jgi:L-ascorbate metabolism protein UlaG (beta-lactamase superfamily)
MGEIVFHGHACTEIVADDGTRLLLDPWLTDNGLADVGPEHFHDGLDYVLLTHGHFDHTGDAWDILRETGATLVATFELVSYAQNEEGVEDAHPLHIGGGWDFPFGRVKMTPALHGGQVAGENGGPYSTFPAGYLITVDGTTIHHAGDTALLKDMELLRGQVDVALLPIGDNFTMGPEDAARAVEMIRPEVVVPIHYDTFELIEQDPERFRSLVGDTARVVVLQPGDAHAF